MESTQEFKLDLPQSFVEHLVDIAKEVADKYSGANATEMRELVDSAEVVFAIWQDQKQPYGVGLFTIKGDRLLLECFANGREIESSVLAISFSEEAEARAFKLVFGEPDTRH